MNSRIRKQFLGIVAASVLAQAGLAQAQSSGKQEPPAQTSSDQERQKPSSESDGAPREGIKVHGHWTIEVRNPDGKLVTRREFENALSTNGGGPLLVSFLSRQRSVGHWIVTLESGLPNGQPQPCSDSNGAPASCWLHEVSSEIGPNAMLWKTLSITTPPSGGLLLSGTAIASHAAEIRIVRTINALCAASQPPSTPCSTLLAPYTDLTMAQLPNPIPVVGGQSISVTVVISFS